MRVFSNLLVVLGVASADFGEPIVSLEKVTTIFKSTADLGIDSVKFVSVKLEEALPESTREHYAKFTEHVAEYKAMVVHMYHKSIVKHGVDTVFGAVASIVMKVYEKLNHFNHLYLDSVIEEFEYRFPSSSGLLGQELIDRGLTFGWLIMSVQFAMKMLFGTCCRKSRKL